MSIVKSTDLNGDLVASPKPQEAFKRYELRSSALKLTGSKLLYQDGKQEHSFDFSELYFPPTNARPVVTRLSDYPLHVDTLLAAADLRLSRSRKGLPPGRSLSRQFYFIRHLLDWLSVRGIYRLEDSTEDDLRELLVQLAKGGWDYALSLEARWGAVLDHFEKEKIDLGNAFHLRNERGGRRMIETLQQPFWRARLGWGGVVPLTATAKARLENVSINWSFTDGWAKRYLSIGNAPSQFVLRNMMGWLNDLATLPASVDRLGPRAASSPTTGSKKLAKKASSRTANLQVNDAVTLINTALRLLYEIAPLLLDLYEDALASYPNLSGNKKRNWLYTSASRERLEKAIGKPITHWTWSGHHPRSPTCYAVDEILAAVQGACAIILAAMNARRQREICDRHLGIRVGDLIVLDEKLGLYQCWFYVEKTYRERHLFYVNQTSANVLQCLSRLKNVCSPIDSDLIAEPSLFNAGRFTEQGPASGSHFSFSEDGSRTRSLISFFKVAYDGPNMAPEVTSHMFRRFYAILYYHRYEHAELRALRQHLRHLDIAMTRVYVTDPSSRPLAEQIGAAIAKANSHSRTHDLKEAIESESLDIQNTLEEIGREKLKMAVDQILNGAPAAGGFSKMVRKLYRQMLPHVIVTDQATDALTEKISSLFTTHGYRVKPMLHGQCHAPDIRRNLKGACERDNILAREHATPHVCGNCPFHFNNNAYMQNLQEQLTELASDTDDFLLSPQQQIRAQFEYENLKRLIALTDRQMAINANIIIELSSNQKVNQA